MSQSNINRYINPTSSRRHDEITLLINHAKNLFEETDNESTKLYNSICRSISILLVSHLEGFIKDFTKEVILDINEFVDFKDINKNVKRQYISNLMVDLKDEKTYAKNHNKKIEELIVKFENIDNDIKKSIDNIIGNDNLFKKNYIEIPHEPFLVKDNKNPKANILNYVCKNFGIDNIFAYLKESTLEIVFENDKLETDILIKQIYNDLINATADYPFSIKYNEYALEKSTIIKKEKTNWEEFLENLLNIRHQIVHGSTLENITNHNELKDFEQKTILIQYGIILLLIHSNFTTEVSCHE
jgi:hypothetical protein